MKSAEFAGLIRKRGYTKEYVTQLIEARDREVTAKALREAARFFAAPETTPDETVTIGYVARELKFMADRAERGES